ncbi:hypothetical protein BY996DRAFT_6770653 [Phakopsora pachyrhizi]|nr:hypothetical protein BY996DRAFT_6770653 [Phakopsora pachyrhizi]
MLSDSPKWIGPNFLSMTISQAEAEGYLIFTVLPTLPSKDPSAPQPGSLIECEADERAYLMMMFSSGSASPDIESNSLGSSSSTLNRRPRDKDNEGNVVCKKRRIKRVDDQRSPVDEMLKLLKRSRSTQGFKPLETDKEDDPDLIAAISASLLKTDSDLTNNSSSIKGSEKDLDEPSCNELRQRRLARFS